MTQPTPTIDLPADPSLTADLTRHLSDEFAKALNLRPGGRLHRVLQPVLLWPVRRFARLLAATDAHIGREGFCAGAAWLADQLVRPAAVHGAQHIPADGPLLLTANHPGAYDSVLLIKALRRDDLLVITSFLPTLMRMPHANPHFHQVRRGDGHAEAMVARAKPHLEAGGALLIFPSGNIDPDPALDARAEAALGDWSSSIGLLLQAAPRTQALVAVVGNILSPRWLRSPIARTQPDGYKRRRLAEFMQISQIVLHGRPRRAVPRLHFAPPLRAADWPELTTAAQLRDRLVEHARALLATHLATPLALRPATR